MGKTYVVKCPICGKLKGTLSQNFRCCQTSHMTQENLNTPTGKPKIKQIEEPEQLPIKEPEQLPPLNEEKTEEQEEEGNVCGGCGAKLGDTIPFYCPDCGAQLKEDEEVQNADS